MSDYDKILNSAPINKTAAIVTSQAGCDDNFLIKAKEEIQIYTKRKHAIEQQIVELKKIIGIDYRESSSGKLPRKVLNHPEYKRFLRLREDVNELRQKIMDAKTRLDKKDKIDPNFFRLVTLHLRHRFPDIYSQIEEDIKNGVRY